MDIVEVKCKNCGKKIYIQDIYIRNNNFCTLGCLDTFKRDDNEFGPFRKTE